MRFPIIILISCVSEFFFHLSLFPVLFETVKATNIWKYFEILVIISVILNRSFTCLHLFSWYTWKIINILWNHLIVSSYHSYIWITALDRSDYRKLITKITDTRSVRLLESSFHFCYSVVRLKWSHECSGVEVWNVVLQYRTWVNVLC